MEVNEECIHLSTGHEMYIHFSLIYVFNRNFCFVLKVSFMYTSNTHLKQKKSNWLQKIHPKSCHQKRMVSVGSSGYKSIREINNFVSFTRSTLPRTREKSKAATGIQINEQTDGSVDAGTHSNWTGKSPVFSSKLRWRSLRLKSSRF